MYYYNMAMTNVPRCSCANVLRSKSFSSVLRLQLWYTRRARVLSMDSLGQGSGLGGSVFAGNVERRCAQGCGASMTRGPSTSRLVPKH